MPSLTAATTRADALRTLRLAFSEAQIEEAALDARVLLSEALGVDAVAIAAYPEAPLGEDGARKLVQFAARRLAREPVARIVGWREFWGMPFELAPETLVPRPDTETVIETTLRHLGAGGPERIVDLGTGSGCLLVALLHELPAAFGLGVDRSFRALATARRNAERNGVGPRAGFVAFDWAAALGGGIDVLVSNPPYVPSDTIAELAPEVRAHDPRLALDGGADGLSAYRAIFADTARVLAPGGLLVVEIGLDQSDAVPALAAAAGLALVEVAPDLSGRPRAVALKRPLS